MGLKIFISSRFWEFEELRAKIAQEKFSKIDLGLEVELLDHRGGIADDRSPALMSIEKAGEADLFVLLLGESYQEEPYSGTESYTHQEYNKAKEKNIPILAFPIGDSYTSTPQQLSDYPLFSQLQEGVLRNHHYHTSAPPIANSCSVEEVYEKIYESVRDFMMRLVVYNKEFMSMWGMDRKTQRRLEEEMIFGNRLPRTKEPYIQREIDSILTKSILYKSPKVLFIYGEGGVGKSTLLRKFSNTKKSPSILIDLQKNSDMTITKILSNEAIIKHCPTLQKALHSQKERDQKEPFGTEFNLIQALQEDMIEGGVVLIDTFEKNKNFDIQSTIIFDDNGIKSIEEEKPYRWRDYIEELIYLLGGGINFVIAGRNRLTEVSDEIYLDIDELQEVSLDSFSQDNIQTYLTQYPRIPTPTQNNTSNIYTLTKGNPLLVNLFATVVRKYYDSWEQLDYKSMKKIVEEDKKYGLHYYLADRILSHIDGELWRLVVPRVLHQDMEHLLKDDTILERAVDAGLAHRGNDDMYRYYLLDSIYDAIVAHSKKKPNSDDTIWYDRPAVRELHLKLKEWFKKNQAIDGVNSEFEVHYHTMMSRKNFEKDFKIDRGVYVGLILSSISIPNEVKVSILKNHDSISSNQISEFVSVLREEQSDWFKLFSQNTYKELKYLASMGELSLAIPRDISSDKLIEKNDIINWYEDLNFLLRLQNNKSFKKDGYLSYLLGVAYNNKKEYNKAIEFLQEAIESISEKAEAYHNLGAAYGNKKEYDKAIEFLQKSIEIDPNEYKTYLGMGIIYGNKKEHDKAIEFLQKSIEINPQDAEAYYNLGIAYSNKKEYDKAIEFYHKAIEINPQDDKLYFRMGNSYTKQAEYDKAMEYYQKAVKINPQNDEAYFGIGHIYVFKNEDKKALESYQQAININPENDDAYYMIGSFYHDNREYEKALELYQKAIKINPNNDEVYFSMGNIYRHQRKYSKAIESYKKSIAINSKNGKVYHNMGYAYENKGEYSKAIESYKKSVVINPQNSKAYNLMGNIYKNNAEYDKAIESYQKVVLINPRHDEAYYNMGYVYDDKGEYSKAIESYKKSLEINPKDDGAYYNMGIVYRKKGEYDKAIDSYKKSLEINPKDDKTYYSMGYAYDDKGEYSKAIKSYQKAIEINSQFDEAYYNMGYAYENKGDYSKAVMWYQKALEINLKNFDIFEKNFIKISYYILNSKYLGDGVLKQRTMDILNFFWENR